MLITIYDRKETTQRLTKNFEVMKERVLHYCKNCNTQLYGEWEYFTRVLEVKHNTRRTEERPEYDYVARGFNHNEKLMPSIIKEYKEEINNFKEMRVCPICGQPMERWLFDNASFQMKYPFLSYNTDYVFSRLEEDRFKSSEYEKIAKNRLLSLENAFQDKKLTINPELIKSDFKILKQFVSTAFQIESEIYSTTQRLLDLYKKNIESEKDSYYSRDAMIYESKFIIEKLEKENKKLKDNYEKKLTKDLPKPPVKPKLPPQPEPPTYKKSYFFNRKSIELKNEETKRMYEKECKLHEEKCKNLLENYNEKNKEYKELVDIVKEKNEKTLNKELDKNKKLLTIEEEKINKIVTQKDKLVSPAHIYNKIIEDEISKAEELLEQLYLTRKSIYSSGIIFPKYCNFVAIASFNEYLSSGRCVSLEGPEGAYNLYENELRANLIIEKLTEIVSVLHKIEKNQFMLYSAIKEANEQLSNLNKSLNEVKVDIKNGFDELNKNMKIISKNTKLTAYYSCINAHYSKKIAETTDALGYLVALK